MVGFDKLFEISFEVCNKVGGIYTVISSKARLVTETYKDKYITIGPYYKETSKNDFIKKSVPKEFEKLFSVMNDKGIILHYGIWDVKGNPKTILVELDNKYNSNLNVLKSQYWEKYKLDSLGAQYDFNEPLLWASAVGELIQEYAFENPSKTIVAHAHEWLSGFSIMKLKEVNNVSTVFTTHATMLGRTLCNYGYNIYNDIEKYNPEELAYKYNMQSKFLTEKICANIADSFTTVSEITGIETKYFFNKVPDVITENGLDSENYYDSQKNILRQLDSSSRLKEFISYYFSPFYSVDVDKSIILFVSGRYEFKNKGIDLFIKSLGKLNKKLKELNFDKNIIVLFLIPRGVTGINNLILYQKSKYRHFKTLIDRNIDDVKSNILKNIMQNKEVTKDIFSLDFNDKIRKSKMQYFESGNPPLSAFDFDHFFEDSIIKSLNQNFLTNNKDDLVKVVDYPVYLNGNDGLLDMNYEEVVLGTDLGIFPSYYEPWGYTPLENAMLGIPALTCDVAGYGDYISKLKTYNKKGVLILNRKNKTNSEVTNDMYKMLLDFVKLNNRSRIEHKLTAKKLSEFTDWKFLYDKYKKAYEIAIINKNKK